jgi:hypothetical protein
MNLTLYIDPEIAALIITSLLVPIVITLLKRAGKSKRK